MATVYYDFGLGVAVGTQAGGLGSVNATTAAQSGTVDVTSDGAVLGDPSGGIGETGIGFTTTREEQDVSDVSLSYTRQPGSFLSESGTITITCALRGAGNTAAATPVDGDMNLATHYPGLDALLKSAGLTGAAWTGAPNVGHVYVPAAAVPCTIKVWEGANASTKNNAFVFMDCFSSLSLEFKPGSVPLATFTIPIGSVYLPTTYLGIAAPTFSYGTVASVSSPIVKAVANSWGGSENRGFSDLTISIDSKIEETEDSNSTNGMTSRQTGRSVTISGTLYSEETNTDFERERLIGISAPTNNLTFTVGTAADGTATNPCLAFYVACNKVVVSSREPAKIGPSMGQKVDGYCTGATANTEFELRFI